MLIIQKMEHSIKYVAWVLGVLGIFILCADVGNASELARKFLDAVNAYNREDYSSAVSNFSEIARSGIANSKLFYNLGNGYLKKGEIGQAILWYERALKITPHDPDIKFNYDYAMSLVKDEREDKEFPIVKILFFWKYLLSASTIQYLAIIFNVLFWISVLVIKLLNKRNYRWISYLILVPALIFISTAIFNYYESAYLKEAIIIPPKVSVRSGLTDDSTELFALHAGTKVKIEKERDGFYRIYYSEGKIGWIKKGDAEPI